MEQYDSYSIWLSFFFFFFVAPHETRFLILLISVNKNMPNVFILHCTVFLCKQTHGLTIFELSQQNAEAKSDVICCGKDWKQSNWFNNVISNTSNDRNPLKLK